MALTYNNFKSTTIKGSFNNLDYPDGSIQASANFQRNVDIKGNINLGNETSTTDATTNVTTYTDTGGNILVKINGITYTITPTILSYLNTLNSNVQTQITNIINNNYLTETSLNVARSWSNTQNFQGINAVSVNASGYYLYSGTPRNYTQINFSSFLTASSLSGYQTISNMSNYLTTSNASATYQPIGSYLTETSLNVARSWSDTQNFQGINAVSVNASGYYLYTGTPSNYTQINFSSFLTASALTAYQTIANMSNYVLNSSLSTTLSNYVLNSTLSTTLSGYLTSASLSSFLTVTDAAATYETIADANSITYINSTYPSNDGGGTYLIKEPFNRKYLIKGGIQQITLQSETYYGSSGMEITILTNLTYYNTNNILYGNIQLNNGTTVTSIPLTKNATFRFLYYLGKFYQL
jgi:hypothetical protein